MNLFLSTYINKVDKKGRVSVPASFRSVMKEQELTGIVIRQSFINNCIEACSIKRIESLNKVIEQMDVFSETKDAFAMSLLGESVQLSFDPDGRVLLPSEILHNINVSDQAAFVGKGAVFEIWDPQQLTLYKARAREIAINHRNALNFDKGENEHI